MAQWRDWNPSNHPDTCLWCGAKLRHATTPFTRDGQFIPKRVDRPKHYSKPGDYGDGYFCGLRCAHSFAVDMAGFGHRIKPRQTP